LVERVALNREFLGCAWSLPDTLTFTQSLKVKGIWWRLTHLAVALPLNTAADVAST
jgi:hypothetical protein